MFHHVVLITFSRGRRDVPLDGGALLCARIRSSGRNVRGYIYGPNQSARRDGLDWAIVSRFESSRDHDDYQVWPLHQEMKAYMTPFIQRIVVCDIDEETP